MITYVMAVKSKTGLYHAVSFHYDEAFFDARHFHRPGAVVCSDNVQIPHLCLENMWAHRFIPTTTGLIQQRISYILISYTLFLIPYILTYQLNGKYVTQTFPFPPSLATRCLPDMQLHESTGNCSWQSYLWLTNPPFPGN